MAIDDILMTYVNCSHTVCPTHANAIQTDESRVCQDVINPTATSAALQGRSDHRCFAGCNRNSPCKSRAEGASVDTIDT